MTISIKKPFKFSLDMIFIFSLFYLSPFFDALTGFLVHTGIFGEAFVGSPSQLLRFSIVAMSIRYISRQDFYWLILLITYLVSVEAYSFLLHGNSSGLITSFSLMYKIIYPFFLFFALKTLVEMEIVPLEKIYKAFFTSGVLYSIGILVPFLLGVGVSTYSTGAFGQKGFYASGNAVGFYLGVLLVFSYLSINFSTLGAKIKLGLIFLSILLIGTKAALLFIFLFLGIIFFEKSIKVKMVILILMSTIIFLYADAIYSLFSIVFEVVLFRYEQSDSIWAFIFSGRDNYVVDAIKEYNISGIYFFRVLIGSGAFLSFRSPDSANLIYDTLETDFFDVFFIYGLIGILIYVFIIIRGLYVGVKHKKWGMTALFFVLVIHSLLAGHVVFNGMSMLAFIIVYLSLVKKKWNNAI